MADLAETLIELEHEGWRALSDGTGADYYRRHLTDDALMAFDFGVMDRQAALDAMAAAPPWARFEIIEPRVVGLTGDAGIVVYRVTAAREGQPTYHAVISSTFVRRDGEWKLAFHQQTRTEG